MTERPAAASIRASAGKDDGLIRVPAGGRAESGAVVRIRMSPVPVFGGSVNQPVYVAPAASRIVSPGCAWSSAFCKSPPRGTSMIPARCIKPPWAAAVAVNIKLNAIRNGSGRTSDAGGIIHDAAQPTRIRYGVSVTPISIESRAGLQEAREGQSPHLTKPLNIRRAYHLTEWLIELRPNWTWTPSSRR